MGYVVSLAAVGEEAEEEAATATCRRGDEVLKTYDGFPLQAGDIITSGKEKILLAFLDDSAVTLDQESSLKIEAYPYPARRSPTTVSVESGSAFFAVTPRPDDAHFMVRLRDHTLNVKGTKFVVYTTLDNTGKYLATISVTQGSVTLSPNSKNANEVDITAGTQVAMTVLFNNITGYTPPSTTLQQKNLSKDQIKALASSYVNKTSVSVSNSGAVTIKSITNNNDGSVNTTSLTVVGGKLTKSSTSVKSGKTVTEKISESLKNGVMTGTLTETNGTTKITAKLVGGAGTATVKDGKESYKGTVSVSASNVETVDATSKNGDRIVTITSFQPDGSTQQTITKFANGSTTGTQTSTITAPSGTVTTVTAQVTTALNGTGTSFVSVAGTTPTTTTTGTPKPPIPGFVTPDGTNVTDPSNPTPVSQ